MHHEQRLEDFRIKGASSSCFSHLPHSLSPIPAPQEPLAAVKLKNCSIIEALQSLNKESSPDTALLTSRSLQRNPYPNQADTLKNETALILGFKNLPCKSSSLPLKKYSRRYPLIYSLKMAFHSTYTYTMANSTVVRNTRLVFPDDDDVIMVVEAIPERNRRPMMVSCLKRVPRPKPAPAAPKPQPKLWLNSKENLRGKLLGPQVLHTNAVDPIIQRDRYRRADVELCIQLLPPPPPISELVLSSSSSSSTSWYTEDECSDSVFHFSDPSLSCNRSLSSQSSSSSIIRSIKSWWRYPH